MRPTRQFRPLDPVALEDRVAPSTFSAAGKGSQAGDFALNIADTLAAGLPVSETRTIRSAGAVQTESWQINPNSQNDTTYTTKTITLPGNAGTEQAVEFSYSNGANQTTDVTTTNMPDGTVQTRTEISTVAGNTTQFHGYVSVMNQGVIESYTGTTVTRGAVDTTDKTVTLATGIEKEHNVVVHHGELRQTETDTVTNPNGTRQTIRSTTTIVRLQPPSAISVGASTAAAANVSGPKLG